MGLSGASKKERKAKKAAAEQYYKAFAKVNEVIAPKRADSDNLKELDELTGGNASARAKVLARKADREAREFNKDTSFKEKAAAYNDRYAVLKEQMANKAVSRFTVGDSPLQKVSSSPNAFMGGGILGQPQNPGPFNAQSTQAFGGLSLGVGLGTPDPNAGIRKQAFSGNSPTFKTREEAMEFAKQKLSEYQAKELANPKKADPFAFLNPGAQQRSLNNLRPEDMIQETRFNPFGILYRNLGTAEQAAEDLNRLGESVSNSVGAKALEKYASLAAKLKPMVKKEMNAPTIGTQSMVAGELAQAAPYTEAIQS